MAVMVDCRGHSDGMAAVARSEHSPVAAVADR
jgi:hypothetical protein